MKRPPLFVGRPSGLKYLHKTLHGNGLIVVSVGILSKEIHGSFSDPAIVVSLVAAYSLNETTHHQADGSIQIFMRRCNRDTLPFNVEVDPNALSEILLSLLVYREPDGNRNWSELMS